MHDSSQPKQATEQRTCDYCGAALPDTKPGALYELRFCSDDHKNAYWTKARKVGDAALRAAKTA